MNDPDTIRITQHLQQIAVDVFVKTLGQLQIGMSELDIAHLLAEGLTYKGITGYWYDVPQNVLIGVERFKQGTTTSDYRTKSPSKSVQLENGLPVFIDVGPMDSISQQWGDWASTFIFHPNEAQNQQVQLLADLRTVHRNGFSQITSATTGKAIFQYYKEAYGALGVELLDVRANVGHSIHLGEKKSAHRIWINENNSKPLGVGIFAIEPGGYCARLNAIGRFEECIYIPESGAATMLNSLIDIPLKV